MTRIMHRDIKPANCLMDKHQNVKLGDFGLARELDDADGGMGKLATTHVGTPCYMSPEMINEQGYNETSEKWAGIRGKRPVLILTASEILLTASNGGRSAASS